MNKSSRSLYALIEGGRVAAEAGVQFAYTMDFLEELTQLMNETHNGVIRAAGFPDDWPKQLERASSIIESVKRREAKAGQSSYVIPVDVPRQGE